MQAKTVSWNDIRQQVLGNPEVQAEYEALEEEFKFTRQVISLRKASGLSQREFATLACMEQLQLARIESGKQSPKLETIICEHRVHLLSSAWIISSFVIPDFN
jgi:DNA-binding transcriptional regulator YiaG